MRSLTDSEVISTLDRYDLMNLGGDPTPDRQVEDWIIEPLDINELTDARSDEIQVSTEELPESVDDYQINESHIRDAIINTQRRDLPPPADVDAFAWYLPIHFYGPEWGIYLREDAIEMFAGYIWDRLPNATGSLQEIREVWRAAAYTLYLHEAFHHKVESFAIRLEITRMRRTYIPYFDRVYRPAHGTDDQLEEIIATHQMYQRLKEKTYRAKLSGRVHRATLRFLEDFIPTLPPSYRLGLSKHAGRRLNELCSQISEASLTPAQPPSDWNLTPNITRSIFNKTSVVYILIPRESTLRASEGRIAFASVDKRRAMRYLEKVHGYVVNGGGGGHTKFIHESLPMVVIPSARELSPPVLRSTAKSLGMTVREFATAVRNF